MSAEARAHAQGGVSLNFWSQAQGNQPANLWPFYRRPDATGVWGQNTQ